VNREERHEFIIDYMLKNGVVTVSELSARLAVSSVTIRRDLSELQAQGLIKRFHGRAEVNYELFHELSYERKEFVDANEKGCIAAETVKLFQDGDIIFLDKGTTVAAVAEAIDHRKLLTVVTNSLTVANIVKEKRNIQLILIGGVYERALQGVSGPLAVSALQQMRFDKAVMGIGGVSIEHGLTTRDSPEVELKRTAIAAAEKVILPVSSSKIQVVRLMCVAPITAVHTLLTTKAVPAEVVQRFRDAGVTVVLCPQE